MTVTDMELEQELNRPYAYVGRASILEDGPKGMDIIDLSDPSCPQILLRWRLEDQDLLMNRGGMDVPNKDGLIAISDMTTGFWTFRMDGFEGWNGEHYGMPNISSVQDWNKEAQ